MTSGIVVVIPAYQPSPTLPRLVAALCAAEGSRVVVVDDGSGPDYLDIFSEVGGMDGVEVLRHETNHGKGAALRTAFDHVVHAWPEAALGVVTADADGQHTVADIQRIAQETVQLSRQGRRVLVLGERDFSLPDIPWRSRFGNRLTTAIVSSLLGRSLPDTQTGLRGLSAATLPELTTVAGDRFDYEMRALIHLLSTGADVSSVSIDTVYEGGQNTTTHFRPVQDSVTIYAALLRQLALFALASVLGFAVDILAFVLVMDLVFDGHPTIRAVGVATLVARIVSGLVNYGLNRQVVFHRAARREAEPAGGHRSFYRYLALAVGLLLASWLSTTLVSHLLGHRVVWAKLIADSLLFLVSFRLQRQWVFPRR